MLEVEGAVKLIAAADKTSSSPDGNKDAESPVLLPDPSSGTKLDWNAVKTLVPKVEDKEELVSATIVKELIEKKEKKGFDELSREVFPPRTKSDISLRRSRLYDWVTLFRAHGRSDELTEVFSSMRVSFDVIFVTNLVVAVWFFGIEWFRKWESLGALEGDLTHFVAVAKKVHDLVKVHGLDDENWLTFVECNVLSGYRSLPFPGFDVFEEARALANGGEDHDLFGSTIEDLCSEFLPLAVEPVDYIPFRDWVESGAWATTGASSVGELELEVDGKRVKIKARKNMVPDVVSLTELADMAIESDEQVNKTVIKSELGKVRLAVAGDLLTYLKMTWVNRMLGGAYYQWPGNTSEESFVEQTKRMWRMLRLCAKCFGLPYDYKGFDHQPTLREILAIVRHLCKAARLNVPASFADEYDHIVRSIVQGFYKAVLITQYNGKVQRDDVKGGLMSGLRWTSVVGNAWNSIMTGLCLRLLKFWGFDSDAIERFIRGDDSAIFVPDWATGAACNVAFNLIGAKAGDGKFSLKYHEMEFLRIWFDERCHGYPMRVIPSLTQRKPWSNQPWSEDMMMRALSEALRTLRRRWPTVVERCDQAWDHLKRLWARNHNLPVEIFAVPVASGGLGLEPPPVGFHLRCVPAIPKVDPVKTITIKNQTDWRRLKMAQYLKETYGITDHPDLPDIAAQQLATTIMSDNIPSVASRVRQEWLSEVRNAHIRVERDPVPVDHVRDLPDLDAFSPGDINVTMNIYQALSPEFGSQKVVTQARADYRQYKFDGGFRNFLRAYYPPVALAVSRFHSSWHISEILDYLEGKISLCPRMTHPALNCVLSRMVAACVRPRARVSRCSTVWLGSLLEPILWNSTLSRYVYSW